jgi:hypothetical protein
LAHNVKSPDIRAAANKGYLLLNAVRENNQCCQKIRLIVCPRFAALSTSRQTKGIRNAKFCISDIFKNSSKNKYSQSFARQGISALLKGSMAGYPTDIFSSTHAMVILSVNKK